MSPGGLDPRRQREAVSVAERMIKAFLEGKATLALELSVKLVDLDAIGNYAAAAKVAARWAREANGQAPSVELRTEMAGALGGDPLASLLA